VEYDGSEVDEERMAFRIRPDESVAHGMRRLAAKSLKTARAELARRTPPGDETVHEARKNLKKVCAIVEAFEDDGALVAKDRKRLRRVNRVLSPLRDADAMLATLTELRRREPTLFTEHTFAHLRRDLSERKRKAVAAVEREGRWQDVDRDLRALRASVKRWQLTHRGFKLLERALRTTHRNGRRALKRAERSQDAADFHAWRKLMKVLWYELRLLENGGEAITRHVAALHRAEASLGDEHNVVVLCGELSKDASVCAGPFDVHRLTAAADRYQCELRGLALASARPIYRRRSRDYVRAIERAWKTAGRSRAGHHARAHTTAA
jgi:hypothetical protein